MGIYGGIGYNGRPYGGYRAGLGRGRRAGNQAPREKRPLPTLVYEVTDTETGEVTYTDDDPRTFPPMFWLAFGLLSVPFTLLVFFVLL
jgi:hypothetical protein